MATTPQLSPLQNDRLRAAMREVWEKRFDRNSAAFARELGLQQPTISEFMRRTDRGASFDTAKRFSVLVGKPVDGIIGPDERDREEVLWERGNERIPTFREMSGYTDVLKEAIAQHQAWSPLVWEAVGNERVPPGRTQIVVEDLLQAGERLQDAAAALERKGLVRKRPAAPIPAPTKTPYRRYMSDVRRIAGIDPAPPSGHMKVGK